MTSHIILFSGNANPELAQEIAQELNLPLGDAIVSRYSDGESRIEIQENVRGHDVFIIQPTSYPCNENLVELLLLTDALHRASAHRITAVIPYFGYARQDKRSGSARVPISAKVVADLLVTVGVQRVLTVDLHSDQIQGFFSIPVDNTYGSKLLLQDILKQNFQNPMIVSPDVGGVVRARAFAKRLNESHMAVIDKRRPRPNESKVMNIIGNVKDRDCIIVDDMIDTAGTLCHAATALKEKGARKVVGYCTHAILSGQAIDSIVRSDLDEVVVTNTIRLSDQAKQCQRIRQLSIAPMLAEAIRRMAQEESISSMFS